MATEYDTSRAQYDNYRFCYDNGHQQWVNTARKCFNFWNNQQWDAQIKAELDRAGRPALTLNVIESLVRSMKGIQRALRNDVRFAPVHDADAAGAQVRDALWLDVQNQNGLDFKETDVYEKGLIMGRAYYDVRVSYDESMQGNVIITSPRSQDIILDPSIDTYETPSWPQVISRRWASTQDVEQLFGKEKANAVSHTVFPQWMDYEDVFMSQQMGRMPYYLNGGPPDPKMVRAHLLLDRQYFVNKTKEVFVDMQTGDVSDIPEAWDRNRIAHVIQLTPGLGTMRRKVKTARWVVTCESTVLHDSDSPYKNFTIVPYFPTFVDGITMGAVESLLDPQEMYNKVTSQELHIINTTANSGYKIKQGSLQNMTIEEVEERGAKTGSVFELREVGDMEKIQPNQTPAGHDRLSFKADAIMRSLSGVPNSGRGFSREDVSGDAIDSNRDAMDTNFSGWLSQLHRTKVMLATRAQECITDHYTETRTILISQGTPFNPSVQSTTINQPTPEGTMLNDVSRGRYSTVLVPAPTRTTMSESDFKLLLELRTKVGIKIPDELLIELSPAANKGQIIKALQQGTSSAQDQAAAQAAEQQKAQTEQGLAQAKMAKEQSAAQLNQARAAKAQHEAQTNPDAAYLQVETERIALDKSKTDEHNQLAREKQADTRSYQDKMLAMKLTELEHDHGMRSKEMDHEETMHAAEAKENRISLRRTKKS